MVAQELSVPLAIPGDPDTAVPVPRVPCFIPKERPDSLSLDSTGVFIKITVYFVPSGSGFNLLVL